MYAASERHYLFDRKILNRRRARRRKLILKHISSLCYDICHAAVGFENPEEILASLNEFGIKVGRIQVSSAL
jgi:hypothetical protein